MGNLSKSFKYVFFIFLLFSVFSITSTAFATPTVSVNANPISVYYGNNSVISWDSADTDSCTLSGGGITGSGTSNAGVTTNPVTSATTYNVNCVKDAIPAKCISDGWGYMPMYDVNYNFLNPGNIFCDGYTSYGETACTNAEARPGQDPMQTVCAWFPGTSQESASDSATVTINSSVSVSVTANPTAISCGQNATIDWSSSQADSCDSGGHGTSTNDSFTISPTTTTNYSVTCTKEAQVVPSYCSGTYLTDDSYCGGPVVSGSYCGQDPPTGPYEGTDCSIFDASNSCYNPNDAWCKHPCHWVLSNSGEVSCSTLTTQTSCGGQPTCTWHPQTTSPAQSDEDNATVTVTCSESVDIYDADAPPPGNGPYLVHTGSQKPLKIEGSTNLMGKQCELFKDGVSFVENGFTNPWVFANTKSFSTNSETSLFNPVYKVICDSGQAMDIETVNIIDPDLIASGIVFYPDENPVVGTPVSMYTLITNQRNFSTENSFSNFFQVSDYPDPHLPADDLTPAITVGPPGARCCA